jgi:hypothetical protein
MPISDLAAVLVLRLFQRPSNCHGPFINKIFIAIQKGYVLD